jgi:predicted nucleic acid-binding protein
MDRVFMDANILLSAAWRPGAALQRLWWLDGVEFLSSEHAAEEAWRNPETPAQRGRLTRLLRRVLLVEPEHFTLPRGVHLPTKDLSFHFVTLKPWTNSRS